MFSFYELSFNPLRNRIFENLFLSTSLIETTARQRLSGQSVKTRYLNSKSSFAIKKYRGRQSRKKLPYLSQVGPYHTRCTKFDQYRSFGWLSDDQIARGSKLEGVFVKIFWKNERVE